jgi:hypothetical protein
MSEYTMVFAGLLCDSIVIPARVNCAIGGYSFSGIFLVWIGLWGAIGGVPVCLSMG